VRTIGGIVVLVYLLIGVLVANNHHYFANVHGLNGIVSAILAVILWPLILVGVDLHIGANGKGGKAGLIGTLPSVRALAARLRRAAAIG
jgi:hypothetical protein